MGLYNCSMFCCVLLCVHSSFAIILMGKRELVLSSCSLVIVVWLFLTVSRICLQFVIVVFPHHAHYFSCEAKKINVLFPIFRVRRYPYKNENVAALEL